MLKFFWKKPQFIPLRFRFILMSAVMLIVLLGALAILISILQSRTIRRQLEDRGISIAQSLSAATIADFLTYNYVALERSANQAAMDPDIQAVIFHDKEGRIAGYSDRPDLQNTFLTDELSRTALTTSQPLIQPISGGGGMSPGIDIALPVVPQGADISWGTIRVQLSLEPMYDQITQIQFIILAVGFIALVFGTLGSIWAANRITEPLNNLMLGTQSAAAGNLDQDFRVHTGDEVEVLAANFNTMIREIVAHRTQLEQQLEEIKRLQHYTERLLTTMSDGLLSVTMSGQLSTINPSAQQLLEVVSSDTKDVPVSQSLKRYPQLLSYIETSLADPADRHPRELLFEKKGITHTLLISSSVLRDRSRQAIEIILNLHDITELKKMEASVRQAERLAGLGTLAAGMAHEIRNPLSSIQTFVQLLPKKRERPDFMNKFNRTVPRELKRINQLVEDLLDLARVPKYTFRAIPIQSLITQTIETLDEELQSGNIESHFDLSADLPTVRADSNQLAKAFHNLVRNAIQAMPDGGKLLIEAYLQKRDIPLNTHSPNHSSIALVFQDSGEGIPEEDLNNIFNPFYTTKIKGTGLGLSITHKVISEHGGTITVTSPPEGGTKFVIHLPV